MAGTNAEETKGGRRSRRFAAPTADATNNGGAMQRPSVWDAFAIDVDAVDNGVWVEVEDDAGRVVGRVRARPADANLNPDYRRVVADVATRSRQYMAEHGVDELPDDVDVKFMAEIYSRAVFTEWDFVGRDGRPLPSDRETMVSVLSAPEMRMFFAAVRGAARKVTNFKAQEAADAVKN